jgi:hypothetical protein
LDRSDCSIVELGFGRHYSSDNLICVGGIWRTNTLHKTHRALLHVFAPEITQATAA